MLAQKSSVFATLAVMVVVPAPCNVIAPVVVLTVATDVFDDSYVTVPLLSFTEMV
jgi:hypothetical protein